jgi:hypothetical protein
MPGTTATTGNGTATPSIPVPLRTNGHSVTNGGYRSATTDSGYRSATSGSWGASPSPHENGIATGTSYVSSSGGGGWSLPRSSVRSVSVSSHSPSGSASDEESVDVDADGMEYGPSQYEGRYGRNRRAWKREDDEMELELGAGFSVREEDEGHRGTDINSTKRRAKEPDWDGLEMDMDMD